jgi:hypothetical protein
MVQPTKNQRIQKQEGLRASNISKNTSHKAQVDEIDFESVTLNEDGYEVKESSKMFLNKNISILRGKLHWIAKCRSWNPIKEGH